MASKTVNLRVDDATLARMDMFVEYGMYSSRSSLLRTAVIDRMARDEDLVKPVIELMQIYDGFDNWFTDWNRDGDKIDNMVRHIDEIKRPLIKSPLLMSRIIGFEKRLNMLPLARDEFEGRGGVRDRTYDGKMADVIIPSSAVRKDVAFSTDNYTSLILSRFEHALSE